MKRRAFMGRSFAARQRRRARRVILSTGGKMDPDADARSMSIYGVRADVAVGTVRA